MRGYVIRPVSMVGVALAICTPALVTAQVLRTEKGETTTKVLVEKKAAPAAPRVVEKKKTTTKTVTKEAVTVLAAPLEPGGRGNANAMMVKQWTTQFRPILQVEYLFVRVVCDPTKEQRILIARAGLKALDESAKKYVDWQQNRNRVVGGRLIERPAIPDTRHFIQDALAAAVKANLSASQAERYRVEIEARAAEQKRVALLNLVAKLDQVLVLSPEQRDKIKESLSAHWNEGWSQGFQNFNLDDQYLPMIPDPVISAHLNDEQKKVWNSTQKIMVNSNGMSVGMAMNNSPLDEAFSDAEALKEDPKPEPNPNPEQPEPGAKP